MVERGDDEEEKEEGDEGEMDVRYKEEMDEEEMEL